MRNYPLNFLPIFEFTTVPSLYSWLTFSSHHGRIRERRREGRDTKVHYARPKSRGSPSL